MARKHSHGTPQVETSAPRYPTALEGDGLGRCEHCGQGGTYVLGEDGVRRLVERTEEQTIRSVDEANAPKKADTSEADPVSE